MTAPIAATSNAVPTASLPATSSAMHAGMDILPAPSGGVSIEALYMLMAENNDTQAKTGKAEAEAKFSEKKAQLEKLREALQKAAEEKEGGFLSDLVDVAKVVGVVAAAAATVATAGAASPLLVGAAIALSAGGFVVTETKCLDPVFGEGTSQWIGLGMSLAGSVGGGIGALGAESALAETAVTIQGGAKVVEGAADIGIAAQNHAADEHMIDATKARKQMERLDRALEDIIAKLDESKDSKTRASNMVNQMIETQGQTLVMSAGGRA